MRKETDKSGPVLADPSQWSEQSQRSISFHYVKEYTDIHYACWRCKTAAVFTAADQKYTYEVRKASIDQHRILCPECWRQLLAINQEIKGCEEEWSSAKVQLSKDKAFLSRWHQLLISKEEYVPYHSNTAAKNMLQKLLRDLG